MVVRFASPRSWSVITLLAACTQPPPHRPPVEARLDAALPPLASRTSSAATYRQHTFYDYRFYGKKVGYLEALDEPGDHAGTPAIRSVRKSVITVKRGGDLVRMESNIEAWSAPDGSPLAFTHVRNEGAGPRSITGKRAGNVFEIELDIGAGKSTLSYPLEPATYLNASIDALTKPSLLKCAPSCPAIKGRTIVEEDGSIGGFSISLAASETVDGTQLFVIDGALAVGSTNLTTKEWFDAAGVPRRIQFVELGAEMVAVSEADAKRMDTIDDIFTRGRLASGANLPRPSDELDELSVELFARAGAPPNPVADDHQLVERPAPNRTKIRVKRFSPPKKGEVYPSTPPSAAAPELTRALAKTPYEPTDDPRIVAAAKQATTGAKDRWQATLAINRFVFRHIEKKTLAQAFSTAIEALDTKEGDCTEHAVLASTLLKAVGIPARLITGLVYVGGDDGGFGYHAWVEAFVGGLWVPIDPTFGQDVADPSHLKFTSGSSDPEGLREAGVAAAALFGNIDLRVTEYLTRAGERVRLEGPR
ncbi:MAG: lasso peptide biosynthesis protein [Deltaproteobacteria bacterium]|nr:lasso peptide biosynthesis protein [Deltaproteobacteria bacterium]